MKISTALIASAAFALLTSPVLADYEMPPMGTILKTVPIVVDATVTKIDPETGAAHLEIHRLLRVAIDSKRPSNSKVALTCVPGRGLRGYEHIVGVRWVLLLESEDTLYEGSTLFGVTGDPEKPDSLQILYPHASKPGDRPGRATFEEFGKLITQLTKRAIRRSRDSRVHRRSSEEVPA